MRKTLRGGLLGSLVVSLLVMALTPAQAHFQSKNDPNDVAGPLDIKSASFSHRNGVIRVSQTTRGDWTKQTLASGTDKNDTFFEFQFDSKGNPNTTSGRYADYFVVIDNVGGDLKGLLFRWVPPFPTSNSEFVGYVNASRDGRTARAKFGKGKLNPRDSYIAWNAESFFTNNTNCSSTCQDSAPATGLFIHNL